MSTSEALKAGQTPLMVGQRWKDASGALVHLIDYNPLNKSFRGERDGRSDWFYDYQGHSPLLSRSDNRDLVELIETGPLFEAGQVWLRANGAQVRLFREQDGLRAYFVNPEDDKDLSLAATVEWHRPDPCLNLVKLIKPNTCSLAHEAPQPSQSPKPPLGLRPRFVAMEDRIKEINEAIERYRQAHEDIPVEWLNEKNSITGELDCLSFDRWWANEGSGMPPRVDEDQAEHVHRIARIAWNNGFFKARCYEATL